MNDKNSFLSRYNKNNEEPKNKITVKDVEKTSFKYEQKSGFKKPKEKSAMFASKSKSKIMVPIIIGAVVLTAVVIGLVLLLGGGGIEMKDFTDWEIGDVQLWANENSIKLQIEKEYSDAFDENKVISQSTVQGTKIKKGDFIKLTVSLGYDLTVTLELPDLMSMTKEQIEAWADENFMIKVRLTAEYNNDVALGNVIRFEVNDNTVVDEVRRDTPIYIIVSKGIEDETLIEVVVPDFKTMAISECYVFANDNGLLLTVEELYDDYVPKGSIISQSVKAEATVKKGDEIKLTVSKGQKIIIPDFSDYSKENAAAIAGELGISVTIEERYSSSSAGRFLSQSIDEGTVLNEGDYVELCYSVGNKIVVSSFIGQTRDAIENWAKELNELDARITIKATYTQNNAPSGTIVHQDIANQVIGRKTTINITVSKGKTIFVPDFVAAQGQGYDVAFTREKALEMCDAIGIVPIFVEEIKANRLPGEIWYQSIAAGTEISEGSIITLKFTPATATTIVPDFLSMTKAEVLAADFNKSLYIIFEDSEEVVEGYEDKIFEQTLSAGTTVVKGSAITLYIGAAEIPVSTPTPTL